MQVVRLIPCALNIPSATQPATEPQSNADIVSLGTGGSRETPLGDCGLSMTVISERCKEPGRPLCEQRDVDATRKAQMQQQLGHLSVLLPKHNLWPSQHVFWYTTMATLGQDNPCFLKRSCDS
uniref:Uncharacterized protein n=1 Tax=Molossus molossus TaxID=27622 RepID=A0A7J8CRR0_MOLMO|nr:hypothetical protein HJG59_009753 [Molossus molossus]